MLQWCDLDLALQEFARALGDGRVLAVDIDDAALSKLKGRLADQGLKNVETVKGKEDDPLIATTFAVLALLEQPTSERSERWVSEANKKP